ncbi:rhodanese-like domain-containing protein [Thauera sinica]|uniref:Rhodanese-like domain-containing protein n=1 Tax=Thauera sinica TaxID=2665146 RepID=A0ABW1ALX9_9RHOO|nr:rhodanese-like domain-containing protein [Thauera sp. K11]ATE62670.1 sulfurtransferase [Thauera sp. K11]
MEFLQQNWYWAALAAASGSWLLFDFVRNQGGQGVLSPVEATLLINREDAIVVDVRDQGEYAQGHVPNARHVPLAELARRTGELEKFKSRPLILYCASGARSASAVAQLKKAGFEKLYNLRGGLIEWEKAGQPVSRKRK